ncbi:LytTR family DNA-binding domain-containing protein [Spirosoma koreense]
MPLSNLLKLPGLPRLSLDDVLYMEGFWNYTTIRFVNGKTFVIARTLQVMQQRTGFLRIHKSFLVNPAHIEHMASPTGRKSATLHLRGAYTLEVARRRYSQVKQALEASNPVAS